MLNLKMIRDIKLNDNTNLLDDNISNEQIMNKNDLIEEKKEEINNNKNIGRTVHISDINNIYENNNINENITNNNKEENDIVKKYQMKLKNKELKEKYGDILNKILSQMKKIQETQIILNNSLEDIRYTIDKNYSSLNSRLKILENEAEKNNYI